MNAFLVQTPDINILENVSLSSGDDIKLLSKRGIIKPKISLPPLGTFRFYFSKLSFFYIHALLWMCLLRRFGAWYSGSFSSDEAIFILTELQNTFSICFTLRHNHKYERGKIVLANQFVQSWRIYRAVMQISNRDPRM